MMTFYLNDCISESVTNLNEDTLVKAFCSFLAAYSQYTRGEKREDYQLLLKCEPEKLIIGGKTIAELIALIPHDLEHESMRKKAYSMFNNYPSNLFIENRNAWGDDEWQEYEFLGQNANNLFVAHKEGWCIASVPIRIEVSTSPLAVIGKTNKKKIDVLNWYTKNTHDIKQVEYSYLPDNEKALKILPYIFDGKQVIYSDEFISQFMDSHCNVRDAVLTRLLDAHNAGLLFPAGYDGNIVKKCQGKGNELTYELRQIGSGMRTYFYCDEQRLILVSLHTKAESSGVEQTGDINHASKIIRDMLI